MRVILQKDVKNLGQAGDIISVKKGYARHLLFPKKWAIPFTEGSAAAVRHRQKLIEVKQKKALVLRQALVEKLKDLKLSFVKEADASGKLFGSLTAFEISKELRLQGYEVDKKVIKLEPPLKEIGEHKILLDFGLEMKTEIHVHVSSPASKKENAKSKKSPSHTKEKEVDTEQVKK
ncbi:MAG: 50S ribosomal protein L9 [Bdellovibrionales bacterium]|nr:50S ribosomal protein L9 [Bdellovibrionales bacterium]